MKGIAIAGAVFLAALFLCGCAAGQRPTPIIHTHWQPWTNEVTTAQQLASALEARWDLERIRAYCDATPPTPDSIQNLVPLGKEFGGKEWRGTLHEGKPSGFDRIWWYAAIRNGKLNEYSVNVIKGRDHWIIEIGNEQTLSKPPVLSGAPRPTDARD